MFIRYIKRRLARMRAESHEIGWNAGRLHGAAEVLVRQLELKFGPLPAPYLERIRSAGDTMLLRWSERVLMAVTLPAVFEGGVGDELEG